MRRRRGIVLAAVTVVVAASLWTTVALLARAGVETAGIDGGSESIQEEAAVHSAVLVLASELFSQRGGMRIGKMPSLDSQFVLWESGHHAMVARLLPVEGERRIVAEAGRVDLNHATPEQLAVVLDEPDAVVAARNSRRFDDVRDVLPLVDQDPIGATAAGGICERLTVHAHEPNVQQSGELRINLDIPWSEELADRIRERFDDKTARALEEILAEKPVETDADLVRLMLFFRVPPSDWPDALDAFSMEPVRYRHGRIDINAASAEVLATLPGVSPDQATAMTLRRDDLDDDLLATPAWPFIEGVLPVELAVDFLDRTTVGSWTWRLRVACGEVPSERPDAVMRDARLIDVVIDVAGEQPRIASLRDVTMRPQACAWPGKGEQPAGSAGAVEVQREAPEEAEASTATTGETAPEANADESTEAESRLGRWRP